MIHTGDLGSRGCRAETALAVEIGGRVVDTV